MREFELISQVFRSADYAQPNAMVAQSIGDDCALLNIPAGYQLAMSTDSLLEGVHCPNNPDPFLLGQRALAVAVSDLAAVGATPVAFTLALSVPQSDRLWLQELSRGLRLEAQRYGMTLVGGDTTCGPLNLGVTVLGVMPAGQALLRSHAQAGEQVFVSGSLGAAAAALQVLNGQAQIPARVREALLKAYWTPQPQLELGQWLRGKAGAVQDISDGLLADAGHIAVESGVQLCIERHRVPVANAAQQFGAAQALEWALTGGDDYQLIFTLPVRHQQALCSRFRDVTCIGRVQAGEGILLLDEQGQPVQFSSSGYQHFS